MHTAQTDTITSSNALHTARTDTATPNGSFSCQGSMESHDCDHATYRPLGPPDPTLPLTTPPESATDRLHTGSHGPRS